MVLVLSVLFCNSIGIGIDNSFLAKVLILVLSILFTSIVNNPAVDFAVTSIARYRYNTKPHITTHNFTAVERGG